FFDHICVTGFDGVHLLNSWGASFCKNFQQMGHLKPRMSEKHNPWILTSAIVRHRNSTLSLRSGGRGIYYTRVVQMSEQQVYRRQMGSNVQVVILT
ncbi:hypothetical protein C8J57DRAFT_1080039, partial [Mycena rebaudengoi]